MALGPVNVVGYHQEVTRETHLHNHADFVFGLLAAFFWNVAVEAALHAFPAFLDEPAFVSLPLGHVKYRHVVGALIGGGEVNVALLGY